MSALQSLYNDNGAGELPRTAKFLLFKRGLKRLFGPADEVVTATALGVEELEAILASLDHSVPGDVRFGAQIVVAFFLTLRTEDHTEGRLRWGDIYPQGDTAGQERQALPPGGGGRKARRARRAHVASQAGCPDRASCPGGGPAGVCFLRATHLRGAESPSVPLGVRLAFQAGYQGGFG